MPSLAAIILAIARAIPAVESILRQVIDERDKDREREAQQRKIDKDKAVDSAIDAP